MLCGLLGHKPPVYARKGWWSPGEEYGYIIVGVTDGTGRVHCEVMGRCARCGNEFKLCRVHLPERKR